MPYPRSGKTLLPEHLEAGLDFDFFVDVHNCLQDLERRIDALEQGRSAANEDQPPSIASPLGAGFGATTNDAASQTEPTEETT